VLVVLVLVVMVSSELSAPVELVSAGPVGGSIRRCSI
jgi:hypothetical protein